MCGLQKALKLICIFSAIWSALGCVVGIFILLGVPFVMGDTLMVGGVDVDAAITYGVTGSIVLFSFAFNLIVAFLGIRGAKDPAHIGVFKVVAFISVVLSILAIASDVYSGQIQRIGWSSIISTLFMLALLFLAVEIQRDYIATHVGPTESLEG